jgi:tetratricopeptide (TPR) repeat protein
MKIGRTLLNIFKHLSFVAGLFFVEYSSSQDLKKIHQRADKAIKHEHFTEAIPLLKTLLAHDSSNSETLFNLALATYNTGDHHGCIKYATQGIEVDSAYAAHHFRRGVCYSQLEDYPSAIRDYAKAIELDRKAFSYFNRAIARWKSGDANGGITDFTTTLAMEPKHKNGFYYRALCYEEIGDTVRAIADLDNAISLKPKDPDIYDERAYLRFLHQNYSGARADYLKCVELDPTYVQAHLSLSEISLIMGDWLAAYQYASDGVKYSSNVDERVIGLLFKCSANKLLDRDTSSDEAMLNSAADNLEESSWEFDDLQQALKKQNVSEAKRLYITLLIRTYYEE